MYNRRNISPLGQIVLLIALILGGLLLNLLLSFIGLIPSGGIQGFSDTINHPEQHISQLKFLQITQSICTFIIPAYFYPKLSLGQDFITFFKCNKGMHSRSAIVVILSILAAVPFINFLGDINAHMSLPPFLSGIEEWMQNTEQRAAMLTEYIVSGDHLGHLMINLAMIAVLPAIGEELIFRGILQNILKQATRNKHLAIWLAAFIFSAFHLQFYGFLPRFFLGIVLGYLYYASGSLWLPILAHFINNAFATTAYFLSNNGYITDKIEHIGTGDDWITAALSASILLIIYFYLERNRAALQLNEFK